MPLQQAVKNRQEVVVKLLLARNNVEVNLKDNKYKSILISIAVVFKVDSNCGQKSALSYTPIILAIITVIRILVLYKANKA